MMNIVLIEDRIERMKRFNLINLTEISVLKIITGKEYDKLISELNFQNLNSFNGLQCIISHKSALNTVQRDQMKKHCEENNKPLIFFSGGISYSFYSDDKFPYLNINATDFYSEKLVLFIKEIEQYGRINLSILQFGKNWRLNQLLNFRNDFIKKINENNIRRISDLNLSEEFKKDIVSKNEDLKFLNDNELQNIDIGQINLIQEKINSYIIDLV